MSTEEYVEPKRGPGRAPNIYKQVEDAQKIEDEQDLRSWWTELGADQQEVNVRLVRKHPKYFKGVQTEGSVGETFHEFIDENYIKERFGGGVYSIYVSRRDEKGRLTKNTSRTIRVAGNPKLDADGLDQVAATNGGNGMSTDAAQLAGRAMEFMQQTVKEAKAESRSQGGMDPALIQALIDPMRDQVRQLAGALEAKDRQLMHLLDRPKNDGGPTFQDRIMEKMVDGESARIESLRTQHDSELRQLKSIHQADLDRERDRAVRDLDRLEKQHARELETVGKSQYFATEAMKTTYESRIDALKSEITRLQTEMVEAKTQIGELKAKKEKTLPEQAQEIVSMQEALKSIGIGGKEEEDDDTKKPWFERIASNLIENPEAIGQLIGGVKGATGPTPEQVAAEQQAQLVAQHQQARLLAAKRKAKKARATVGQPVVQAPDAPPLAGLSETEVRLAITFMESAIQNGTEPEVFAAGARSAIPGDILRAIERVGIDQFLEGIALPQESQLRTQRGRTWVRAVAGVLLQGTAG